MVDVHTMKEIVQKLTSYRYSKNPDVVQKYLNVNSAEPLDDSQKQTSIVHPEHQTIKNKFLKVFI